MGLDIVAISEMQKVAKEDSNIVAASVPVISVNINPAFAEVARGITNGYYTYTDSYSFRAGSYSGYNNWRRELSITVLDTEPTEIWNNPDAWKDQPFVELINFSDCEGVIGTDVCRKLTKDFSYHLNIIKSKEFKWLYIQWMKAFELASEDGCILFM